MIRLTEKTFLSRALHCYDNPQCVTLDEFESDLNKFSRVKKLITAYLNGQELNEKLLLNQLVVLYNVFGLDTTDFLLFKLNEEHYKVLFPFLILLNRMPDDVLIDHPVVFDQNIVNKLRIL